VPALRSDGMLATGRDLIRFLKRYSVYAALTLIAAGCGGSGSADQALNDRLSESNTQRVQIAKFSGTVTIDHSPPGLKPDESLMLMLYDPKNPPRANQLPLSTRCGKDGYFEFTTYTRGDGVQAGSYKVLFAAFKMNPLRGGSNSPDALKNLYNDPDTTPFSVDISAPGKTEWNFDLEIAGKEANTTPGEHAITRIVKR
jgi:hypothetical protein